MLSKADLLKVRNGWKADVGFYRRRLKMLSSRADNPREITSRSPWPLATNHPVRQPSKNPRSDIPPKIANSANIRINPIPMTVGLEVSGLLVGSTRRMASKATPMMIAAKGSAASWKTITAGNVKAMADARGPANRFVIGRTKRQTDTSHTKNARQSHAQSANR